MPPLEGSTKPYETSTRTVLMDTGLQDVTSPNLFEWVCVELWHCEWTTEINLRITLPNHKNARNILGSDKQTSPRTFFRKSKMETAYLFELVARPASKQWWFCRFTVCAADNNGGDNSSTCFAGCFSERLIWPCEQRLATTILSEVICWICLVLEEIPS